MSWSITFIGSPENVSKALHAQSEKMEGQSKKEYDSALPHMVGIVNENFGSDDPIVKITAAGHGYASDGEQKQRNCTVSVERIYGMLV